MKMKTLVFGFVSLCILGLLSQPAQAVTNETAAPDFAIKDVDGHLHSLSEYRGKYVVLEWVNYDCPFVKKHYDSHNMQDLQQKFTSEGVVWLSINSSAEGKQGNFPPEQIKQRMADLGANPTAYLIDTPGAVGKLYGAQTTPHIFLIAPDGTLKYQGAIDSIESFDQADIAKATNYLLQAFEELKNGKAVSVPQTKSYGCSVKY